MYESELLYNESGTLSDVISLKVQAPSKEEASELFTEKLKELKLQEDSE